MVAAWLYMQLPTDKLVEIADQSKEDDSKQGEVEEDKPDCKATSEASGELAPGQQTLTTTSRSRAGSQARHPGLFRQQGMVPGLQDNQRDNQQDNQQDNPHHVHV